MLYDDDGISPIDEAIEDTEQDTYILEVQSCRGLIEDIDGLARVTLSELGGELDTLALTP